MPRSRPPQTEALPFLACAAIGAQLGIPVRAAPDDGSPEDPLQSIAQRSNFRTRMVHLDSGWHKRNNGPILGYWKENNQPVALLSRNRGYLLYDPASGERRPVDEEAVRLLDPTPTSFIVRSRRTSARGPC